MLDRLNAFYSAYMAYFGAEAEVVTPDNMDAKDRATMAGIRAALAQAGEAGTAETVEQGSVHEHAVGEADAPLPGVGETGK